MACEISQAAAIFIERVTTTVDLDQHLSEINSILTVAAGSSGTAVNIISCRTEAFGKVGHLASPSWSSSLANGVVLKGAICLVTSQSCANVFFC